MSLLTDKDILDILEPVTDPALVAKLRDNAEDLAIFMSEYSVVAGASQTVTLKAVAEWMDGKCDQMIHGSITLGQRLRRDCCYCMRNMAEFANDGKMPGEEK